MVMIMPVYKLCIYICSLHIVRPIHQQRHSWMASGRAHLRKYTTERPLTSGKSSTPKASIHYLSQTWPSLKVSAKPLRKFRPTCKVTPLQKPIIPKHTLYTPIMEWLEGEQTIADTMHSAQTEATKCNLKLVNQSLRRHLREKLGIQRESCKIVYGIGRGGGGDPGHQRLPQPCLFVSQEL